MQNVHTFKGTANGWIDLGPVDQPQEWHDAFIANSEDHMANPTWYECPCGTAFPPIDRGLTPAYCPTCGRKGE